jgi:hypothetical protein
VAWPLVVLTVGCVFRRPIGNALVRLRKVRATSKGVELVLDSLERKGQLPVGSRAELSGLSAHDIWALDSFANGRITTLVAQLNPAQRVAARALRDAGLLTLTGDGPAEPVNNFETLTVGI